MNHRFEPSITICSEYPFCNDDCKDKSYEYGLKQYKLGIEYFNEGEYRISEVLLNNARLAGFIDASYYIYIINRHSGDTEYINTLLDSMYFGSQLETIMGEIDRMSTYNCETFIVEKYKHPKIPEYYSGSDLTPDQLVCVVETFCCKHSVSEMIQFIQKTVTNPNISYIYLQYIPTNGVEKFYYETCDYDNPDATKVKNKSTYGILVNKIKFEFEEGLLGKISYQSFMIDKYCMVREISGQMIKPRGLTFLSLEQLLEASDEYIYICP